MAELEQIFSRRNPRRLKERVYVGCGAGFGGDRPAAALKLLQRVRELDYLVLECLAERTLADRYQVMMSGGVGYDPRISKWMSLLLPLAVERGVCIITNMGAVDPLGAQKEVLDVANSLNLSVSVSMAYEFTPSSSGSPSLSGRSSKMEGGLSTYLGAAPIVRCLEKYKPHVVITSRVADAALFLAPMVYELGWNWNDFELLAQGSLAGHLLECGCQLTGGYFMHPGDVYRNCSFGQLLDLSLPFAEVSFDGKVCVAKAEGSGGFINFSTCAEQLLYEVGDPGAYVTPDMVIDFRDVTFHSISNDKVLCSGAKSSDVCFPDKLLQMVPKECGWKAWGEISYGGYGCVQRAEAADFLVRSWMEEAFPGVGDQIISYIVGLDSLKVIDTNKDALLMGSLMDTRLRVDGLFKLKEHAVHFTEEFIALYTNGPAGGGGISTGHKKEIILEKELVERKNVFWKMEVKQSGITSLCIRKTAPEESQNTCILKEPSVLHEMPKNRCIDIMELSCPTKSSVHLQWPTPSGEKIHLYQVAHCRAGDKGNDLNFSVIPHSPQDIERLKPIITPEWVKEVVSTLLNSAPFPDPTTIEKRKTWVNANVRVEIYEARGICSLNVVVRNILDGGVNCSRRIDRHGKCVSDLILCQQVVLPSG
ncbi:hypothetical protein QJS04_geneDACA000460 [Acorus gramineus]|uniref:Uncharacterized protein n=1 Tax=Acorus gramineus TaxID=55184 RepID=A0AAV9AUG8_ACOGR|nr:hypothetical protein QJS04_geneDACA000460 [Acorus gramineus]